MFARVSRFQETEESTAGAEQRSAAVVEKAEAIAGFSGLYYLLDRESLQSIAITLWKTEDAMRQSEGTANQIRSDEATATGSQILGVEHYEVVTAELR